MPFIGLLMLLAAFTYALIGMSFFQELSDYSSVEDRYRYSFRLGIGHLLASQYSKYTGQCVDNSLSPDDHRSLVHIE